MRIWFPSWPRAMSYAVLCTTFLCLLVFSPANGYDCTPCSAPDNGTGTVDYPTSCVHRPCCGQTAKIIDGLPPGTTIEIPIEIIALSLTSVNPGGVLGGEVAQFDGLIRMPMTGTGSLAGYMRDVQMWAVGEVHSAPRMPGDPIQPFDTDLQRLQGQLPQGDPDFDLLRVTAGTAFGMGSPGHVTILKAAGNDWNVDSFFDIEYRIDFVGAPGGPLSGMSGSTTGTIRVYQGCPGWMPGQDHKMENPPQLPDERGWDVYATYPDVLADDWMCGETGPVKDIHFWGSWRFGQAGRIRAFHVKIYSDVPAGVDAPYSHPGNLLWEQILSKYVMTPIRPGTLEGWFNPRAPFFEFDDHDEYWQYDLLLEPSQWFDQVAGTIYWLCISAELEPDPVLYEWGWKSSTWHFNDDAVFIPPTSDGTCVRPDNGGGTTTVPADCDFGSTDVMRIIDGLPPGSTIECQPTLRAIGASESPGGTLGGTRSQWPAMMELRMQGTGDLAGFVRQVFVQTPQPAVSDNGPRTPGTSPQSFPTEMVELQLTLPPGDPDFDLLRITAGSGFGMPSPGHTTLTRLPDGNWNIDSFFDIEYRIDFVGAPGGPLAGMSGSTTATIRLQQGTPGSPVPWRDLYEPPNFTQSLDLSFVITGGSTVTGACCGPNGNCFVTTAIDCEQQGGLYLGDGTVCLGDLDGDGVDDACGSALVRGACCLPNGTCMVTLQSLCQAAGGLYLGNGSVCLGDSDGDGFDDACEQPTKRGACCWSDGTCTVVTQAKCLTGGGVYQGDGVPCQGDLDGNGVDDACERPDPPYKWEQLPDVEFTGFDVNATNIPGAPPYVLADDFLCTVSGPIREIHVFGSWYLDRLPFGDPRRVRFILSIHADIPAQPGSYSRPGELICLLQNLPFTVKAHKTGLREGWMTPPYQWTPWPQGDQVCWEYIFQLPPDLCFQEGTPANPVVLWLDVQAYPDEQGTLFGWKTSGSPHFNDDATWAIGIDLSASTLDWQELIYPPNHPRVGESIDLAFRIIGGEGQPQFGACCWPDGSCTIVTQFDCEHTATGVTGIYQGDGSMCLGDNNGNGVDDACEPVSPTGACCYIGPAGPTCVNTTESDCIQTYNGTWYPGQNCATFNCPQQQPQGACCYADAAGVMHCINTTHKACVKIYGGTWYLGQNCATFTCPDPQPLGACCYGDPASPSCVNTTEDLCKLQYNGTWYAGQNCATFDCPPRPRLGACCYRDAAGPACVNTTKAACRKLYGGTWYAGQDCATFNCPDDPPRGACCYGDPAAPSCVNTTQAECQAVYGGTWYAGQDCATFQCPVPHELGACCYLSADGTQGCATTSQLDCHSVYGGTWYAGQNCATFQCPTPVPTGACCYGTPPQCANTTEEDCKAAYGGTWYAGQDCSTFQCAGGSCCVLRVGDANNSGDDEPTIGDVTVMIDAKFITGTCDGIIVCLPEADINQSGGASPTCDDVTIGDITILIDYLFITGQMLGLPNCL
ncbi:MAG: hypothetical protein AB1772_02500 [Candidatus Zixiibacteriota bacterium]